MPKYNITDPNYNAKKTLEVIKEGFYNLDRSSSLIIKELVDVIKYLDEQLKKKQDKVTSLNVHKKL